MTTTSTATATPEATSSTRRVRYITKIEEIEGLTAAERKALAPVADRYAFRLNDYYLGLIDWSDPADPIRQLVIPHPDELEDYGQLDASDENANTVARGVQHKYPDTALLLCNEVCGAYCRYCFRKRLFMPDNEDANNDVSAGIDYIRKHREISNVLLTGGDPLLMSTRRIADILGALAEIEHVRIVRIGSKMPAFDPWRLRRDQWLHKVLQARTEGGLRIYLMAHFDHPAGADARGARRARGVARGRRHHREPVPADTRRQRARRGPRRAVEPPVVCRMPAVLPVPGPADGRKRALRDPHRRGLAHLPAGARNRLGTGAARPVRDVARDRKDRDRRGRRLEDLPALPPGEIHEPTSDATS